jgi:hypothetical protein
MKKSEFKKLIIEWKNIIKEDVTSVSKTVSPNPIQKRAAKASKDYDVGEANFIFPKFSEIVTQTSSKSGSTSTVSGGLVIDPLSGGEYKIDIDLTGELDIRSLQTSYFLNLLDIDLSERSALNATSFGTDSEGFMKAFLGVNELKTKNLNNFFSRDNAAFADLLAVKNNNNYFLSCKMSNNITNCDITQNSILKAASRTKSSAIYSNADTGDSVNNHLGFMILENGEENDGKVTIKTISATRNVVLKNIAESYTTHAKNNKQYIDYVLDQQSSKKRLYGNELKFQDTFSALYSLSTKNIDNLTYSNEIAEFIIGCSLLSFKDVGNSLNVNMPNIKNEVEFDSEKISNIIYSVFTKHFDSVFNKNIASVSDYSNYVTGTDRNSLPKISTKLRLARDVLRILNDMDQSKLGSSRLSSTLSNGISQIKDLFDLVPPEIFKLTSSLSSFKTLKSSTNVESIIKLLISKKSNASDEAIRIKSLKSELTKKLETSGKNSGINKAMSEDDIAKIFGREWTVTTIKYEKDYIVKKFIEYYDMIDNNSDENINDTLKKLKEYEYPLNSGKYDNERFVADGSNVLSGSEDVTLSTLGNSLPWLSSASGAIKSFNEDTPEQISDFIQKVDKYANNAKNVKNSNDKNITNANLTKRAHEQSIKFYRNFKKYSKMFKNSFTNHSSFKDDKEFAQFINNLEKANIELDSIYNNLDKETDKVAGNDNMLGGRENFETKLSAGVNESINKAKKTKKLKDLYKL